MRKHSQLPGNHCLIVTHHFWVLILTTCVHYGNRSQKLCLRSGTTCTAQYGLLPCQGNCYLTKENWIMPKIDMLSQYVESTVSSTVTFQRKYHFFVQYFQKGQHNPMYSYSAIYHCILHHLDFLLWHCKIVGRMLLFLEVSL